MPRLIYSLFFYLAQPLVWCYLVWRARKQPAYLRHLGERYGFYADAFKARFIWLHAVSVGETYAVEPLINALLAEFPAHSILLTHMTPTGREVGEGLSARIGRRLVIAYLPYDLPGACRRFFRHFRPVCGILAETEIWPNLLAVAARNDIPVALVNARLSERSQTGYRRFLPLTRPAFAALRHTAAQTETDARRLSEIGAPAVCVTGNLKFDALPSPEKRAQGKKWRETLGERFVFLAASTREGEETLILDAFSAMNGEVLLLLVPRHPQRFDEVAASIGARGLRFCRRSDNTLPDAGTRVWLGDSMGEMASYYTLADLALIGGTLLPFGGQNLIEAAACDCPALVGPHTFHFAQAAEDAVACGAALRVTNVGDAIVKLARLSSHRQALCAMREAALVFCRQHHGATTKTLDLIKRMLDEPAAG